LTRYASSNIPQLFIEKQRLWPRVVSDIQLQTFMVWVAYVWSCVPLLVGAIEMDCSPRRGGSSYAPPARLHSWGSALFLCFSVWHLWTAWCIWHECDSKEACEQSSVLPCPAVWIYAYIRLRSSG
jgi:hypothetical protein